MKLLRLITLLLLIVNGAGAITAGWSMIIDPSGKGLGLSPDYLSSSPFTDYLIPGILLWLVNGLIDSIVFLSTLFRFKNYPIMVIMQGVLLTGWISVQLMMVAFPYFLHFVLGAMGIFFIVSGYMMRKHLIDQATRSGNLEYYQTLK